MALVSAARAPHLCEGHDHFAQGAEALVDGLGLRGARPVGAALA